MEGGDLRDLEEMANVAALTGLVVAILAAGTGAS
jgi:hypothetical protein